jgi:hypothetical protein
MNHSPSRLIKALMIAVAVSAISTQHVSAVTSEELATFLGITSWHAAIDLAPETYTIQLCSFSNGKVDDALITSEPKWTQHPEAGLTIIIGPRDGKYRILVKFPSGDSLGTLSQMSLLDRTLSPCLPTTIKEGDYIIFGKPSESTTKFGPNDLRGFSEGFLVRLRKTSAQKQEERDVSFDGRRLVPSQLDPALSEARAKVFTPWGSPDEASASWQKLAKENVPIYKEFKEGDISHDLYIPNPGIAYWVLGGMTEAAFWEVEAEKEKIGDTLVSASLCKDPNGVTNVWALWAPKKRSYLLVLKMMELGITQARVEQEAGPVAAVSDPAANPLLSNGRYLIISYDNDATVQRCAIMNAEDGVYVGFPTPPDHPELALRPQRVYVDQDHFQFSIGPGNYDAKVVNQIAPGTTTYVGQLLKGKLTGVKTEAGWSTRSQKFLLYKE